MDRLFTHRSGAQLWQGDLTDVTQLLRQPDGRIHVIGLFAQEYQPNDPSGSYELIKMGYDDNPQAEKDELTQTAVRADKASDLFSDRLRDGKSCLSSCAMGLNRSSLVSALTLMKVAGMGPQQAVERVQRLRAPQGGLTPLCNPRFVQLIHQLEHLVGNKSAWTKWRR